MKEKKTKIKKDLFREIRSIRSDSKNTGITLIALIITIIILLILAGVVINFAFGKSGIISKSQVAAQKYNKEAAIEKIEMKIAAAKMEIYTTKGRNANLQEIVDYFCEEDDIEYVLKQSKQTASLDKIDLGDAGSFFTKLKAYEYEFEIGQEMTILSIDGEEYVGKGQGNGDNPGTNGGNVGEPLSASNINKVKEKLASKDAIEVNYTPKATASTVIIPSAYNSGYDAVSDNEGVDDQIFSQTDLNATGENAVKWYLLNADETGVTLVSEPTSSSKKIYFRAWGGYSNCLYYLNQITTTLFSNSDKGAVAHCLRLTDIREAAKSVNNWSDSDWETNFINQASNKVISSQSFSGKFRNYPSIYGTSTSMTLSIPFYDENPEGTGIPTTSAGTEATSLTVNGTAISYSNVEEQLGNLDVFGRTGIANELFKNSSGIWLATREISWNGWSADTYAARYGLRAIANSGCISYSAIKDSTNGIGSPVCNRLRAVVFVPASYVLVSQDGAVSIK